MVTTSTDSRAPEPKASPVIELKRLPRDVEERDKEARTPVTFVPPGLLPDFKQDPQYKYRWIRAANFGSPDNPNMNKRFREGWVPVQAIDHPEIVQFHENEQYKGMIEHGGLILCKISKEKVKARNDYYSKKAAEQLQAVDSNFMRENDSRMPLFKERSTQVRTGRR